MKPELPATPIGEDWISRISAGWIRKLLLCVEYAMEHPRGDGQTIFNQSGGTLRAVLRGGGRGIAAASSRPSAFVVEVIDTSIWCYNGNEPDGIAGLITVGSGRFAIAAVSWEAKIGTVYAEVRYDVEQQEYIVGVFFESGLPQDADPRRWVLRIAEVQKNGNRYEVQQIWTAGDIEVLGRWVI